LHAKTCPWKAFLIFVDDLLVGKDQEASMFQILLGLITADSPGTKKPNCDTYAVPML